MLENRKVQGILDFGLIQQMLEKRKVQENFDLRPSAIINNFDLTNLPKQRGGRFYQNTAAYGHFGRNDLNLPWEKVEDKVQKLKKYL